MISTRIGNYTAVKTPPKPKRRREFGVKIASVILVFFSIAFCGQLKFAVLVGDLPDTVRAEKGPYLINSDIYVPAGKSVVITAGTVLLFKNFTGLHVQGTLTVGGTMEKPVVFSSENDRRFNTEAAMNPNPYDWNGIFIHDDAIGTDIQNMEISYSVYGINTLTKFIRIINSQFHDNGRANLTIEGMPQTVTAGPFSYSLSRKNATVDGVPAKILSDPDSFKRNTYRFGGLAVFFIGSAFGAIYSIQTSSANDNLKAIDADRVNSLSVNHSDAMKKLNNDMTGMIVGYAIGLLGAFEFCWSFRY